MRSAIGMLDRKSYDEAVNELLDQVEFATAEELNEVQASREERI
ncbi:hypothetical protein [Haloplanus litoreus]|uniref:Uncharacterized protein n=1 Tax=Haloplanus litoreus TaxID=767515 RepID=A0ABD6A3H4_9EURY